MWCVRDARVDGVGVGGGEVMCGAMCECVGCGWVMCMWYWYVRRWCDVGYAFIDVKVETIKFIKKESEEKNERIQQATQIIHPLLPEQHALVNLVVSRSIGQEHVPHQPHPKRVHIIIITTTILR